MGSQEGRAPVRVVDGTLLLPWSLMSEFPFRRGIAHPLLGSGQSATELSLSNQSINPVL